MRKLIAWVAARPTVAAIALLLGVSVAFAAAGPANYAGIFGSGLHGTPQAVMGCDASTPQNCALGTTFVDSKGNPLGGDVCQNPNNPKLSAVINIGAAATTKIVDTSGTKVVYVCGFHMSLAGTTPTFVFKTGTHASADCDTAAASLSGTYAPTSGVVLGHAGQGVEMASIAGGQLCGTTTGTGSSAQGFLTYVQL